MKVRSVKPCGTADVYNMEVDETHDFAVEGGIIVHNCADESRYLCMARPMNPPAAAPAPEKPYDPLSTDEEQRYDRYDFYRKY